MSLALKALISQPPVKHCPVSIRTPFFPNNHSHNPSGVLKPLPISIGEALSRSPISCRKSVKIDPFDCAKCTSGKSNNYFLLTAPNGSFLIVFL